MFTHSIKILQRSVDEDLIEYNRINKTLKDRGPTADIDAARSKLVERMNEKKDSIKVLKEFSQNELPGS